MAADDPHFRLRIPVELRDLLKRAAEANRRSINAEIVARLATSFPNPDLERLSRAHYLRQQEESLQDQIRDIHERLQSVTRQLKEIQSPEEAD